MPDPSSFAHLAFTSGSKTGQVMTLRPGTYHIGRQPDADIRYLPSEAIVSGNHASVSFENGAWVLRDLGSRNGTLVDGQQVSEHVLSADDVIEFGGGGPKARFGMGKGDEITPTIDAFPRIKTADLYREAQVRARDRAETGQHRVFSTTREFVTLAYHRTSRRARYTTIGLATLTVIGFAVVLAWQIQDRRALRTALSDIASELATERGSRAALQADLSAVQQRYDSLLNDVEQARAEQDETRANAAPTRFVETVNRDYGGGVALIVSSFGYVESDGKRFLRYQLDRSGEPAMQFSRRGGMVPRIDFGGNGPLVTEQASATGFLIDSAGWIVTNRHVAVPWENDDGLESLRSRGLDVTPRFVELRAYFPPGSESYGLQVIGVSEEADVAILGTGQPVEAPPLVLAADHEVPPGEQIVLMGYPTGVHNLLFRIPRDERVEILRSIGERPVPLAKELARRLLIQPLVIGGTVADTTGTEIIHTAETTGGGSGGPIIGQDRQVVGVHYAAVRSPIEGDPFQTQRGVRVEFAWNVLPAALRERLTAIIDTTGL